MTSLRFLFDGKRINDDETPKQVRQILCLSNFFFHYTISNLNSAISAGNGK